MPWNVFPKSDTLNFTQHSGYVSMVKCWLSKVLLWNKMDTCERTWMVSHVFGLLQWRADAAIATKSLDCLNLKPPQLNSLLWQKTAVPLACGHNFCNYSCLQYGPHLCYLGLYFPRILHADWCFYSPSSHLTKNFVNTRFSEDRVPCTCLYLNT